MLEQIRFSRRKLLRGLASAAIVGAFDPIRRSWVTAAHAQSGCGDWPAFLPLPPLDGQLYTDLPRREASSTDLGNIIDRLPSAVLVPGSVQDVAKMVNFCHAHGIYVAARGQHHATHGQGLTCGMAIEMSALNTIHSIAPGGASVDAGVTWRELLTEAFGRGLRPPSVTGFAGFSIGGTLSVGGCPMSNERGALVDWVRELTVVTGTGRVVQCSADEERDLFEAVLAGLGQCGVIVRATVDMVPALPMARTYLIHQPDHATYFRDVRTLLERGEMDEIFTLGVPPGSNQFIYQINATVFFDPASPPDDAHLLSGLSVPPEAVVVVDRTYVENATAVDGQIEFLRRCLNWDAVIKPWFDVWLPDNVVEDFTREVLTSLTPEDVGPTGFVLLFTQRRSKLTRPFFRVPDASGGDWVWLFDITTSSATAGPNPAFIERMLTRNRQLFERARDLGGTRYPIGAQTFMQDDWVRQYGESWPEFARRKQRYDPRNILTPGPGIFPN